MIRILNSRIYEDGKIYAEYAGVSTDVKPIDGIITGSKFTEADTGDVYMFAEGDNPEWSKIQAGVVTDSP